MASLRLLTVVGLACLAPLLFGFTLGFTSPAQLPMEISTSAKVFSATFVKGGLESAEAARFGALVNVGAMMGALIGGSLSERFGRKMAIASCGCLWLVSWLWLSTTGALASIMLARWLTGLAVGIASGTVPVYVAEIAPPTIRGALGAANQLGVVIGILAVYALGAMGQREQQSTIACDPLSVPTICSQIAPQGWSCAPTSTSSLAAAAKSGETATHYGRGAMANPSQLACIGAAIAFVLLAASLCYLPETPAFLRSRGQHAEARTAVMWLGAGARAAVAGGEDGSGTSREDEPTGRDPISADAGRGSTSTAAVQEEEEQQVNRGGVAALFAPAARPPLQVAFGLMLAQQFSGINAVIFFAADILLRGGIADPNVGGLWIMALQVAATTAAVLLVDRLGRRPLLLASCAGMALSACALSLFFARGRTPPWLALVSLVGYIAFFSLGAGAIPWLMMGELFDDNLRATASSVATLLNWSCSFAVTLHFSAAVNALGASRVFILFAGACAASSAFVWARVPETKGRSLEQIAQELAARAKRGELALS
jgi:MFS family permease